MEREKKKRHNKLVANRAKEPAQILYSSLGAEGPFTTTVIYYWMKKVVL